MRFRSATGTGVNLLLSCHDGMRKFPFPAQRYHPKRGAPMALLPNWQLRPKEDANHYVDRLCNAEPNTNGINTEQQFVYRQERSNLNTGSFA